MAAEAETRVPELMAIIVTFFTISFISCALRFYVRLFMIKAFKGDDWLMLVAMLFYTMYTSFSIYGLTQGSGRHMDDLSLEQIHQTMMCWWLGYIWYSLTMMASMGCVASAAVVARFPYLAGFKEPDWLWHTIDVAIWSIIEQGLAITATSLATLRPLFKLAGYHLGLASQPTAYSTSGHKRSIGSGNHGGLAGRFPGREAFSLPSISRPEAADRRKMGLNSRFLHDSEAGIRREIKWEVNLSTHFRSESEAELRSPDAWSNRHENRRV
ncbi:hypothetical protein FPOAC1_006437 [Fusarium poae]|uniref:hypothetical protein n=1 Tax=Fusarium poae TaxID=36050 RepID=UPI001CEB57AB|nr:hypothetical protein FPOAC1_006437 [Fusarium poae]KAG8673133.1 hypothetical protein FPOAC1_006437 [Fusarium poae]